MYAELPEQTWASDTKNWLKYGQSMGTKFGEYFCDFCLIILDFTCKKCVCKPVARWGVNSRILGNFDEDFQEKPMGHFESLEQVVDGVKFLIHCQKEENYMTKIVSCHGILTRVDDHDTFCDITNADGSRLRIQFKYPEPILLDNRDRHCVDFPNNCRHHPIALSDVWRTKWWPNRQFTFLLEVAEANEANERAHARKQTVELQWEFQHALAQRMPFNKWDSDGKSVTQVEWPHTHNAVEKLAKNIFLTGGHFFKGRMGWWKGDMEASQDCQQMTFCGIFWCKERCQYFVFVLRRCQRDWDVTKRFVIDMGITSQQKPNQALN